MVADYSRLTFTDEISCSGWKDETGVWNNGFECPSRHVCCFNGYNRFCCKLNDEETSTALKTSTFNPNSVMSTKPALLTICLLMLLLICVRMLFTMESRRRDRLSATSSSSVQQKPFNIYPQSCQSQPQTTIKYYAK
ncbi:hypothetical protein ACOME3_001532 [Neoechinorhynchus agilis]